MPIHPEMCDRFPRLTPAISRRNCFERASSTVPVLLNQNSLAILPVREVVLGVPHQRTPVGQTPAARDHTAAGVVMYAASGVDAAGRLSCPLACHINL